MNESLPQENTADLSALQRIDSLCDQFEEAWRTGERPRIEDCLARASEPERAALLRQLLKVELELRVKACERVTVEEYQERFPLFEDLVGDLVKKAPYSCSSSTVIDSEGSTGPFIARSKDDPDPFQEKGSAANETTVPRVLGDYEILNRLGKGGMGIVYRARQLSANRIVALKVIRPERLEDLPPEQSREWLQRFRAEGQAAARVDHDNVVTVYEVGEVNGQLFYSMRYVDGRSLADLLRENGPMPDRKAAAYLEPVARALHHVHGHDILHRDLKPGNILVDGSGRPLVADFGLAKWLTDQPGSIPTRGPLGTPDYMAPEQARDGALAVAASDVYSLGATLYALLTGRPPFQAPDPIETLRQVMDTDAVSPRRLNPAIARDLETVCLKCLDKQPHKRYGSAEELASDLKSFLDGRPIKARPVGWAEQTVKWAKRRPAIASLLAAVVVVTILGTSGVTWKYLDAEEKKVAAQKAELKANDERDAAKRARDEKAGNLYIAHMRLAQRAYEENNIDYVRDLLELQIPRDAETTDFRHFEWRFWHRLIHRERLALHAHTSRVMGVAWSPDERQIVSASYDKTLKIWDVATGLVSLTLEGHTDGVESVAWSSDGQRIVSGSQDQTLRLWDATTAHSTQTLLGHKGAIFSVAWSPNCRWIVSGSQDNTIKVWDVEKIAEPRTFKGHASWVRSVAWSPDGQWIVSGSEDKTLKIWDVATSQEILTLTGHTGPVVSVAWSRDGRRIVSGSWDGTVRVWDLTKGQETVPTKRHSGGVMSVAWSPDEQRIVGGIGYGALKGWDTETGQETLSLQGHIGAVATLAWTKDGRRIVSGSWDGTIKVWDASAGLETFTLHTDIVLTVDWSKDGRQIISGSKDKTLRIWDAATGQETRTLKGHTGRVNSVAWSPDGRRIVSGSDVDKTVRVWDAETGREILTVKESIGPVHSVAWSPDGGRIAIGSDETTPKILDATTGQEIRTLKSHKGAVFFVAWSPDGKRIVSASEDKTIKIWDAATGQEFFTLKWHTTRVVSVAWSPDSRRIVSGSIGDKAAKVWNSETGEEIFTLEGHKNGVTSLAWSGDGQRIVSGSSDNTLKVWDASTGQETLMLNGHTNVITSVAWSADWQRIASASHDGSVKVWEAFVSEKMLQERRIMSEVEALFAYVGLKEMVLARLNGDVRLRDTERDQALQIAQKHVEIPLQLSGLAWMAVKFADQKQHSYALALRQAEAAVRLELDNTLFLNTLGVAQYRMGLNVQAASTLAKSNQLNRHGLPANLAFLAMAQWRLGKNDDAQAAMKQLREVMKNPDWARNPDAQGFLREAETVFKEPIGK